MPAHDDRFDRIDGLLERLTSYVADFRSETIARLDVIERRLDLPSATAANLDSRLVPLTKATLEPGSLATQIVRDQARGQEPAAGLST